MHLILLNVDSGHFQKVANHPVHLVDDEANLSPTALIPFCAIGGDLSIMGIKNEKINRTITVPVCNSFKAKIVQDQLCYQVDPFNYVKSLSIKESKLSLILYINFNEDRWLPMNTRIESNDNILDGYDFAEEQEENIIINTIGI